MKRSGSVVVASRSFSKHPLLREELASRYERVVFNETGRMLEGSELVAFLKGHERAIIGLETLDSNIISQLTDLKIIGKHGVGLDKIDLLALERQGIRFGWVGGVNRRSVAELALGFMLSLLRHVPATNSEVRAGVWQPRVGQQLTEKTIGIIGCGFIGKDLIELLKPFRCRVLVNDIRDYREFYERHSVTHTTLDELLKQSDIVTLHIPYEPATHHIISAERLALMKPSAILINTARGGLVDEQALKKCLASGKLAGAAFDVFAVEPPADKELVELPHFLSTPHIGGSAEEALVAMGRAAIEGLESASSPRELYERLNAR